MKHRSTQLGVRKNPDSPRVHGLRLSPNLSSELPLTDVEPGKRRQPQARSVSSSLSRADESETRSSLMTRVLSRGGEDFHEYEKVDLLESSRGTVTKSQASE